MTISRICRVAVSIKDIQGFCQETGSLLGIDYVDANFGTPFEGFTVMFGEHGFEPIEITSKTINFAADGSLIEVAIDVANAGAVKAGLAQGGYTPAVTNHLPEPDADEYLFPRSFHGLPLMVCTAGDNEKQMRLHGPFEPLYSAAPPKIGSVTLSVDDVDAAAADFSRYFGMKFVEVDSAGLGRRVLAGAHRIKLLEGPSKALDGGLSRSARTAFRQG